LRQPAPRIPTLLLTVGLGLFGSAVHAEGGVCAQPELLPESPEVVLDDRLVLTADQVLLEQDGLSTLAGMVQLRQGDKTFNADNLNYDEATRTVDVKSESVFRNRDLIIRSREARFDLNAESGSFLDTEFTVPKSAARGRSERITLSTDGRAQLIGSAYTTCAPDSAAWYLEASRIKLDHEEGLGTARNARLKFFGVPVLYLPYFQFPIDDRRRTGLLYPTIGQSGKTGTDVRWPIYLNLGPNYDATLTPRYMSERGLQPGTDFRYLLNSGKGEAHYEYLDDSKYGEDRSLFRFRNEGLVNRRLAYETRYTETSDRTYFEDLGGSFESASLTHLEQSARLIYQAPNAYSIRALVQNFQPIATNLQAVDDPYKRLPQIRLDALTKNNFHNVRAGIGSEFVNFARDNSVEGTRVDLQPYLRYSEEHSAWYLNGQADLRYTAYDLSNTEAAQEEKPTREIPVFSAEGGLRFERMTDSGRLQLLEPRGFALYVPYENQDKLPQIGRAHV
jgi:LPS-assembly protein